MQSKLDALTARVNEAEERVSNIEDKLMEGRKLRKREKNNYWAMRGGFEKSVML